MQIRLAMLAELPAASALLRREGLPADDLDAHLRNLFVVIDGGRTVGVAGLEDHGSLGLLHSLVVAESHRGRGLAELLCNAVRARASTLGLSEMYLLTVSAEQWFSRRGWVSIPRERAPRPVTSCRSFIELCPRSAVLMRLAQE